MKVIVAIVIILATLVERSTEQCLACGASRRTITELIVGGQFAQAQDWPWHAIILHQGLTGSAEYACGGALISDRFVLTARHCTQENGKRLVGSAIVVQFGVQQLYDWNPDSYQQHAVLQIHLVPRHQPQWKDLRNDIALLELKTVVVFTDYVLPVCLPDRDLAEGEFGTVIGFGLTESDTLSKTLREAQMPVVNTGACIRASRIAISALIDEGMNCAGYTNGTTVCNGDSGGGLVFKRGDSWQLGGVVSFAEKRVNQAISSCKHNGYGVFVNVFQYLPWIVETAELKELLPYLASQLAMSKLSSTGCQWIQWQLDGGNPPGGVLAGNSTTKRPVYVSRTNYRGNLLVGQFLPSEAKMYFSWEDIGHESTEFEVLVGQGFHWTKGIDGRVPQNAVAGGRTDRGDTIYVGRQRLNDGGAWSSGAIATYLEAMFIGFGKQSRRFTEYEVLVSDDPACQR